LPTGRRQLSEREKRDLAVLPQRLQTLALKKRKRLFCSTNLKEHFMNIGLIGFGSRGDVQPFLALALALRERGHTVTLTAPTDCETQITAYSINYVRIPHSFKAILEINVFEQVRREGFNLRAIAATVRHGAARMKHLFRDTMRVAAEAVRNMDMIIGHGLVAEAILTVAGAEASCLVHRQSFVMISGEHEQAR
jgi:hypothetical protein